MDLETAPRQSYALEAKRRFPIKVGVSSSSAILTVGILEAATIAALGPLGSASFEAIATRTVGDQAAIGVGVTAAVFYVGLSKLFHVYTRGFLLRPDFRQVSFVAFATVLLVVADLYVMKVGAEVSRGFLAIFAILLWSTVCLGRLCAAALLSRAIERDMVFGRSAVIVGPSEELDRLRAADLAVFGLTEAGRVVFSPIREGTSWVQAASDEAIRLARRLHADEFLIAAPWSKPEWLSAIEVGLRASPLPVRLLPDANMRLLLKRHRGPDGPTRHLVDLQREPMTVAERAAKRLLDIAIAVVALIVLAPLICLVAAAVRFDSPGPAIFRQRRNGFDQREFTIFKFRTMTALEDDSRRLKQAARDDARVTRLGRILRRTSIDELPQIINVLRGDMSIVGPRPHALAHDAQYQRVIGDYCVRHHVKPGITGWAQVNGLRGETRDTSVMQRRVEFDIWYINNWSLLLDLRILCRTMFEVLSHDAY